MLTPAEAEAAIASQVSPVPDDLLPLGSCAGRVLRQRVTAERDTPPFDRVTMDGVALSSAAALAGRRRFSIESTQAAGAPPGSLGSTDRCIEVMTGAVLPSGCDAVVPVEQLAVQSGIAMLAAGVELRPWQNVHRRGSDARKGAALIEPGVVLRGPEIAVLASCGLDRIRASRRPRVGLVSTGDELVEPGLPVLGHQVRRSNPYGMAGIFRLRAHAEVTDAHVADDPEDIAACLEATLNDHDMVVVSGGVSAGRFDHVPAVLKRLGVRQVFHTVAQRPGRPMWFGVSREGKLVFGLPGNPVAALVCVVRYVLPALARAEGAPPARPEAAALATSLSFHPTLAWFLPVILSYDRDGRAWAEPRPTHGSGDLNALVGTDGFLELPPGPTTYERGACAPLYRW